jgi:hypothetical protein
MKAIRYASAKDEVGFGSDIPSTNDQIMMKWDKIFELGRNADE